MIPSFKTRKICRYACILCLILISTTSAFTNPTQKNLGTTSISKRLSFMRNNPASFQSREDSYSFSTQLSMSTSNEETKLPMLLDIGTKGGALFLSFLLFLAPLGFYEFVTTALGWDGIDAGRWIGVGFVVVTCLLWTSTYIFRVATKDMTYVSGFIFYVVHDLYFH